MNSAHTPALSTALRLNLRRHTEIHREIGTTGSIRPATPTRAETEARLTAIHDGTARAWREMLVLNLPMRGTIDAGGVRRGRVGS